MSNVSGCMCVSVWVSVRDYFFYFLDSLFLSLYFINFFPLTQSHPPPPLNSRAVHKQKAD